MAKPVLSRFLISLSRRSQRSEQTELRDLESRLSQLLIINPRYHPGEPAQVLTRAGQLEKCIHRLPMASEHSGHTASYIIQERAKRYDEPDRRAGSRHVCS
jgi:hypothetical protein